MHAVVGHLEVGDAGAFAFARFQVDEELVGVFRQGAQFIQFAVVAGGDDAAVAEQHRWLLDERPLQQLGGLRVFAQVFGEAGQQRSVQSVEQRAQRRQSFQRPAQRGQVARSRRAQGNAGEDALDVADAAQRVAQRVVRAVLDEGADGALARA